MNKKKNKETWNKIRCALFFIVLYASWMIPCFMKYQEDYGAQKTEEIIESTENIIRWEQEEINEEVYMVPLKVETATEPVEEVTFYDVPLSEELQLHIFTECEKHNISPSIVVAMIEMESSYDMDSIGDNGNSFGLMQIQPKWHQERVQRLGCTDLLDPYQNITVAIDIIAELKSKNPDLYWVLMAYNGGETYATRKINAEDYSDYAIEVVERAGELEDARER